MSVHQYLVTVPDHHRMNMWVRTTYANWLEGRPNRHGSQTWQVAVLGEHSEDFLDVASAIGATVEEIDGTGGGERYLLRVGEPGTGWAKGVAR